MKSNNYEIKKDLGLIEDWFCKILIKIFVQRAGIYKVKKDEIKFYQGLDWLIKMGRDRCIIKGLENLPKQDSFIIALNHMGTFGLVFVIGALVDILKRPIFIPVEERVWRKAPDLIEDLMAFIKRRDANPGFTLRLLIKRIKSGGIMGITVCGTRDKKQNGGGVDKQRMIEEVRMGIGCLADHALVVPVGFWAPDSDRILQGVWAIIQILFLKRKIMVQIGEPISFEQKLDSLKKENKKQEIAIRGKEIVNRVFDLVDDLDPKI